MAPTTESPEPIAARLALGASVRGALIWGGVFALVIVSSAVAYRTTYGTAAERAHLLRSLASNSGLRALFGPARRVDTVAGFTAWRTMGILPLVAGVWGLLAATRALRGEEDSGRWETLLAAPITHARATLATLGGVYASAAVLFGAAAVAALLALCVPGDAGVGGALWLALALALPAALFAAAGALTSQLAPSRREAAALAGALFAAAFVLRVAADGSASLEWLHWLTPLGWVEEMRPLTGAQPIALVPSACWIAALTALSALLARRRDVGAGLLARRDERAPRRALLRSSAGLALRESLGGLTGWMCGMAAAAFLFGFIARSVAELARSSSALRRHVASTTGAHVDIGTARGYLAIVFAFLAVALSLYAAGHATAAREEEAHGRLGMLLSHQLGRRRWLLERLAVAAACAVAVAVASGLGAAAGAAVRGGSGVTVSDMLRAALNMLPAAAVFLGVGALGFAFVPRHTGAIAFGSVGVAYVWEQTGAILKAPEWVLAPSPFHWVALVPVEPVRAGATVVMLAVGLLEGALAAERLRRRDLVEP